MAVNALGGALETTFEFKGLDQLQTDLKSALQTGIDQAGQFEKQLVSTATKASSGFNSVFTTAIKQVNDIGPELQKAFASLDPAKLQRLSQEVQNTTGEFDQLRTVLNFIKENLSGLNLKPEEVQKLSTVIDSVNAAFDGMNDKQITAIARLRQLKNELITKPKGTSAFNSALAEATDLEEKLRVTNQELKLAASPAPGIRALGAAVSGLVGGFEALNGIISLVNPNNENLEKTTRSLIASMAILQGIEEVSRVLEKDSALNVFLLAQYRKIAGTNAAEQAVATEALTVAEAESAIATEGATVATEGLSAAMAANPAGALLIAITAVIGAIQYFSSNTEDADKKLADMNDRMNEATRQARDLAEAFKSIGTGDIDNLTRIIELKQKQGASEREILQLQIQQAQKRKEEATVAVGGADFVSKLEAGIKDQYGKLIELNVQIENINSQLEENIGKKQKEKLEERKKGLQSEFTYEKTKYDQNATDVKNYYDALAAYDEANAALLKKNREDYFKSLQGFAEAKLLLVKKSTADELQAELEAIKARSKAELSNVNLTAGEIARVKAQEAQDIKIAQEKYNLIVLNNDKSLLQARLNESIKGSADELALKISLIKKTAEIELANDENTNQRKAEIITNSQKEIFDLTQKYSQQLAEQDIQTTISTVNAKLSAVKKGTQDELLLKKQLVDDQAKYDILQANDQITNQQLLQAKITEIVSKAASDRKKLEEDYVNESLQRIFSKIDSTTANKNNQLDLVLQNPTTTGTEKYNAELQKLENTLEALKKKQREVGNYIQGGKGDVEELTKQFFELQQQIDITNGQLENLTKKDFFDKLKQIAADITAISSSIDTLASSVGDMNSGLSDTLSTLSDIGNVGNSVVTAIGQFASGDIVGGIANTIKAIAGVFQIAKKVRESEQKAQAEIEAFNQQVLIGEIDITEQYRERQREQIKLNKLKLQGLQDEKALLEQQKQAVIDQYNSILAQLQQQTAVVDEVTKKYGGFLGIGRKTKVVQITETLAGKSFEDLQKLFAEGKLTGEAKALFEELQKIQQEGVDIDQLLADNAAAFKEAITGTTADSISSSILDGFKSGLRSASDFADNFKELMQNALLSALQMKYLEGPLNDFFDQFAALADSGDQLTSSEIAQLQSTYNGIIDNASQQFQQLQQIAGLNFTSASGAGNSLTGAIKGMTEQQAELLAGQFGGLRITALQQLTIANRQLETMNAIEVNTRTVVLRMAALLSKYDAYENGTKSIKVRIQ